MPIALTSHLFPAVASAPLRVLRRAHVAVRLGILVCRATVCLANLTVLVTAAHPILDVAVQFAARDAALPAIHLALDAELVQRLAGRGRGAVDRFVAARVAVHSLGGLVATPANQRSSTAPRPFHVVGAGVAARQRHLAVLAAVDGVETRVGKAEADAINGVEEVEERVVQLGGQVKDVHVHRKTVMSSRFGFLVCDGLRATWRRHLGSPLQLNDLVLGRRCR